MHGGKTPGGPALPQFRTGRYSKYLPQRLLERYRQAARDGDLLALREDLALLDARLADVLQRVDTGESGQRWRAVQAAFAAFARHRARGDVPQMQAALAQVEHELTQGVQDYAAWQDVRSLLDQRARLAGEERRRLHELQQTLTAEQAMTLLAAVQAVILRHVHDRDTLAALAAEFRSLVVVGPRGLPPAG